MDCNAVRRLLGPLADGELDLERSLALETHMQGCPNCAAEFQNLGRLKAMLRDQMPYHRAPAGLQSRLSAFISPTSDHAANSTGFLGGRVRPRFRRYTLAAASCFAVLLIAGVLVRNLPRAAAPAVSEVRVDEVLSGHLRSLMAAHLADVASSDRHTVKPWFAGKLDFAPPVVDLAVSGFPLIAGRLDYLDDRPVAALVYRRNKHIINLFVWPTGDKPVTGETFFRRGYNLRHWTDGSMNYWAVSDMNATDLAIFADDFRREARR